MAGKKTLIVGSREITDYELVEKAIKESGFKISEIISGGAKGADTLAEKYAKQNKIKIKVFKPDWDNIEAEGAKVKERINPWTKEVEKYNCMAGFQRNSEMVNYGEQCIALQVEDTSGTQDTIKKCQEKGIPVFIYPPKSEQKEKKYKF